MSALFDAQTKYLQATFSTTAPTPTQFVLVAAWYNRTVDAVLFDDKVFEFKSLDDLQVFVIQTTSGTSDPRIFAGGSRGSSGRTAVQTSDMVEGTWRLAGALMPPTFGAGSGTLVSWDEGNEVTQEMPTGPVTGAMTAFTIAQRATNGNQYTTWHGRLAEIAVFIVGDQTEAETIMAALATETADNITLPSGSTLIAYYPLLEDASAVVGPALTNNGSVTFDSADHPSLGGGAEPSVFANPFALLGVGKAA
jgi:hypothetical protein